LFIFSWALKDLCMPCGIFSVFVGCPS
jgi:hypothetical protein